MVMVSKEAVAQWRW